MIELSKNIILLTKDGRMYAFENNDEYKAWIKVDANYKRMSCIFGDVEILLDSLREGNKAQEKLDKFEEQFGTFEEIFENNGGG